MTPTVALENMFDRTSRHIQMPSYFAIRQAGGAQCADLPHLVLGDAGARVVFATVLSALCSLIRHVVSLCSQLEVIRVDAAPIVACVENNHAVGNIIAMKELPSQSVSAVRLSFVGELAVADGVDVPLPIPTVGKRTWRESGKKNGFEVSADQILGSAASLRGFVNAGMLSHVVSASNAIGHATGRLRVAVALLLGATGVIIAQASDYYNGAGQVDLYSVLLEAAYRKLVGN